MEELAAFGAGCFWGVEAEFRKLKGVIDTEVGFAGGTTVDPSYLQVCSNTTGHAEVVKVKFDPDQISYEELLDVFWRVHTPTSANRLGPTSQYRSLILYYNEDQKQIATASKNELQKSGVYKDEIVTQILPAGPFFRAEEYHQQYLEKQNKR